MLSSPQTVAPKPAALPLATTPASPGNGGSAGGPSFAQFLTSQSAPPAQPTPAPAPAAQADAEPKSTEAAQEPAATAASQNTAVRRNATPAPKPAGQPAARAGQPTPKADAKADAADSKAATSTQAAKDEDDDHPDSPELKEFTQLIGMATPAAATSPADAATTAAAGHHAHAKTAASADDATPARSAARGPADATARTATDTADTPHAKAAEAAADKPGARTSTELLQAASASTQAAAPHAAPDLAATPSFAATLAQALPALAGTPDSAPATSYGQVQSPVQSNAFAPELGARVSLMAVDGVQHAELQLNPADMGPVSVQIVVDGGQAQVSFHAAQAETRQALEQGLPDLAAALQGQGLTLSGGGVFQQTARDSGGNGTSNSNETDGGDTRGRGGRNSGADRISGTGAGAATTAARRTVGLLDTFA